MPILDKVKPLYDCYTTYLRGIEAVPTTRRSRSAGKGQRGLWERDWDDVVFAPHFLVYLVIAQAFLFPLLPVGPYYLLFNSTRRLHFHVWNFFGKLINTVCSTKSCSQALEAIITLSDCVISSGGRATKCRLSVLK